MHTLTEPIPNPTRLPNVYTLVHKNYISDLSSPILLKLNSPQCSYLKPILTILKNLINLNLLPLIKIYQLTYHMHNVY